MAPQPARKWRPEANRSLEQQQNPPRRLPLRGFIGQPDVPAAALIALRQYCPIALSSWPAATAVAEGVSARVAMSCAYDAKPLAINSLSAGLSVKDIQTRCAP